MGAKRTLLNQQGRKPGVVATMRNLFPVGRAARMRGTGYSMREYLNKLVALQAARENINAQIAASNAEQPASLG